MRFKFKAGSAYLIAEIGNNHEGSFNKMIKLHLKQELMQLNFRLLILKVSSAIRLKKA